MLSTAVTELKNRKTEIVAQIKGLESEARKIDRAIDVLAGVEDSSPTETATPPKRTMSAAARAKLRAFQTARWAKIHAAQGQAAAPAAKKGKKRMSPLGKLRIKFGSLNRYGHKEEAKKVAEQIAALQAKAQNKA